MNFMQNSMSKVESQNIRRFSGKEMRRLKRVRAVYSDYEDSESDSGSDVELEPPARRWRPGSRSPRRVALVGARMRLLTPGMAPLPSFRDLISKPPLSPETLCLCGRSTPYVRYNQSSVATRSPVYTEDEDTFSCESDQELWKKADAAQNEDAQEFSDDEDVESSELQFEQDPDTTRALGDCVSRSLAQPQDEGRAQVSRLLVTERRR